MSTQDQEKVGTLFDPEQAKEHDKATTELKKENVKNVLLRNPKGRMSLFFVGGAFAILIAVGYLGMKKPKAIEKDERGEKALMNAPGGGDQFVATDQEALTRKKAANEEAASAAKSNSAFLAPPIVKVDEDGGYKGKETDLLASAPVDKSNLTDFEKRKQISDQQAADQKKSAELNQGTQQQPRGIEELKALKAKWLSEELRPQIQKAMGRTENGDALGTFSNKSYALPDRKVATTSTSTSTTSGAATTASSSKVCKPLLSAGDALYGKLMYGINSDTGTKFAVAQLLQGSFAGARLIGAPDFSESEAGVTFSKLSIPGKTSYAVKAVAVNEDTYLSGLADNVDNHYMRRFGATFVSSLLTGLGKAASVVTGTTTTTTTSTTTVSAPLSTSQQAKIALGEVGTSIGADIKKSNETLKPTVTVNANKNIGIVFLEDVCEEK